MSGGGGGNTTTVQKSDPWEGVQDFLKTGYGASFGELLNNPQEYYQGQTWVPHSAETETALQAIANRAMTGSPLTDAATSSITSTLEGNNLTSNPAFNYMGSIAQGGNVGTNVGYNYLQGTAQGDYLNANPHLDNMYDAAASAVTRNYREAVKPGIDSAAGRAGRFGSNAYQTMVDQSQATLGSQLGNMASNIYGQNYAQERQNQLSAGGQLAGINQNEIAQQMQAGQMLGGIYGNERANQMQSIPLAQQLANQDYTDIGQLLGVGRQREALQGQQIQDAINRWNFQQQEPYSRIGQFMQMLSGAPGGTVSTSQPTYTNTGASMLGGAATGAGIGTSIMPGWGTAIGAGAGALFGLL